VLSTPRSAGQFSRNVLAADWSKAQSRAAFALVLVITGALASGILAGNARYGVLIASGAFSVGFGSFQQLRGSRIVPMLLAACGMCVSSWVGTLAGLSSITAVIACAAAAFAYAEISRRSQAASWIALQCAIWLVISTAYPVQGLQVLGRGLLILAGGLLQAGVTALVCRVAAAGIPEWRGVAIPASAMQPISIVGATLAIAFATALYEWIWRGGAQNAYWIPMTALIVLRSQLGQTVQRGMARTLGTMIGASLATVIVSAASPGPWVLATGVILFAWASYTLLNVNYTYFAVFLTGYVVFLLSLAGVSEHPLVIQRVLFTALGGALALGMHALSDRKTSRSSGVKQPLMESQP